MRQEFSLLQLHQGSPPLHVQAYLHIVLTRQILQANAECIASAPPPPRKRRRPKVELQNRLARCEQLLAEYANANAKLERPESDANTDIPPPSLTPQPGPRDLNWEPTGKLIVEDGGTRFTDGFLWTKVYEEVASSPAILRRAANLDAVASNARAHGYG